MSRTWSGKRSTSLVVPLCRSSCVMTGSDPGARPRPRSMRPGSERLEGRELLGDHQRRVIRQHDAARSEADPRGPCCGGRRQHRWRRRGDGRHVVVLGEPVPAVARADRRRRRRTGMPQQPARSSGRCAPGRGREPTGRGGEAGVWQRSSRVRPPAMYSAFRGRATRRVARIRRQASASWRLTKNDRARLGRAHQGRRLPLVRFSRSSAAVWRAMYAGRSRSSRHDSLSGPALTVSKPRAS